MKSLAVLAVLAGVAGTACSFGGAYKDVTQHADPAQPRMAARVGDGPAVPLPDLRLHGRTLVWAFATGECGQERWGPFDTGLFARTNVAAFVAGGVGYTVSTGGEAGGFSCDSDAGMQRFVARYDSPRLVGIDFDIERQQTPAQIDALVQRAQVLQQQRPALRLSFTLATHAASDGSRRSLNDLGRTVLAAVRKHRLDSAVFNLMVMNYGPADSRWCVLREPSGDAPPACDMGRSALQAARNLHDADGVPYSRIALTAMLGENDVAGNVFTPGDAAVLVQGAKALGLAGVHHWSLDRDQPCAAGSARVSALCHGLPGEPGTQPGSFGKVLDPR